MQLDLNTTALVITDPQIDVLSPDGALADLLFDQVEKKDVVANLRKLKDQAELAGVPVIYSTLLHSEKTVAAPTSRAPIYNLLRDRHAMRIGGGGAIHPDLTPTAKTVLATPRTGMMAFGTTDLDQLLRARGVKTLVMGGMVLNLCLEANLRAAVDLGYDIVLVSDATATTSDEVHEATLANLGLLVTHTVSTQDFLHVLTRSEAEAA